MKKTLFTILGIALLYSCSDYNAVVKSDDYVRKYELANEIYEKGTRPKVDKNGNPKVDGDGDVKVKSNTLLRSITLYEQVYERMPKAPEGEDSYFKIGKAYYLAGDYYMGGYYLGVFPKRFPFSPRAEEAMFLSAMCSVHNSPSYSLDQYETEIAIANLQGFLTNYPNSVLVDSCNHIIDRLYYKLEKKDYEAVMLYNRTSQYNAAVTTAATFLADHPMSEFEEEVFFVLVDNSILLARNSIENKKKERIENAIERYRNFAARYPESNKLKGLSSRIEELEFMLKEIEARTN